MNADELLAAPIEALELPDGAFPVSAVIVVEYVHPGSDNSPHRRRLAWAVSDELNPWTSIGIWKFLEQHEIAAVAGFVAGPDGDD